MIAVFYDAVTGAITETVRASEVMINAQCRPYLEVDTYSAAYDATHLIVAGRLVGRLQSDVAAEKASAAMARLRVRRNGLLRDVIDAFGPVRWASLSPADQVAVAAYRQALLDLPATASDPNAVSWPLLTLSKGLPAQTART